MKINFIFRSELRKTCKIRAGQIVTGPGFRIQVKMASKDLIQFYIGLIDYIDNNEDALILLEVFNDINTKWNCIEKLQINDKLFHSSIDKENVYYKSFTKSFINQDLQYEGDLFPEIKNITRVKSVSKVKDNKINLINNVDDFILNKLLMTKNASEIISRLSLYCWPALISFWCIVEN